MGSSSPLYQGAVPVAALLYRRLSCLALSLAHDNIQILATQSSCFELDALINRSSTNTPKHQNTTNSKINETNNHQLNATDNATERYNKQPRAANKRTNERTNEGTNKHKHTHTQKHTHTHIHTNRQYNKHITTQQQLSCFSFIFGSSFDTV
jgi:hypothetical protein